eukprot:sb/3476595/
MSSNRHYELTCVYLNKIDNDIMVLNQINLTLAFENTLFHVFSYVYTYFEHLQDMAPIDNDIMVLNQINLTLAFENTLFHVFSYVYTYFEHLQDMAPVSQKHCLSQDELFSAGIFS